MSIAPQSLTVQDKSGANHSGATVFQGKKVLLYFSAHWCPPCRRFTPVLAEFYAEAKSRNLPLECVFVSCDRDEASMWSYFKESHADYYVVPFNAAERTGLARQLGVNGIPCVAVMDAAGNVLQVNVRDDVQKGNFAAVNQW